MELLNSATDFLQAILLLLIVIRLIKLERRTRTSEPEKPPSKPLFKPKEPKPTAEETREKTIMENLEAYDGTGKGQVKV